MLLRPPSGHRPGKPGSHARISQIGHHLTQSWTPSRHGPPFSQLRILAALGDVYTSDFQLIGPKNSAHLGDYLAYTDPTYTTFTVSSHFF